MDGEAFTCKYCEGNQYTAADGILFCDDCGRENGQQFEHNEFGTQVTQSIKIKKPPEVNPVSDGLRQITSWEFYNFILKGITEELEKIGTPPGFKTTVFQIWAFYLRSHEAAFFNKDEMALPRMGVGIIKTKRDKKLLYNFLDKETKKISVKRESTETLSSRSKKRRITKLLNMSQFSDHDTNVASQRSFDGTNLADLSLSEIRSITSGSSAKSIQLVYSKKTREAMLKYMDKEHLLEHARDFHSELRCHSSLRFMSHKDSRLQSMRKAVIPFIIQMALEVLESPYQMSDIRRFIREGHISYNSVQKHFPRTISPVDVKNYDDITRSGTNTHSYWYQRHAYRVICESLFFTPHNPDIYALCRRYCEELALPKDLADFACRLISVCEPTFRADSIYSMRFYEGRTLAYIIFVLKLLFGLNGETENLMSESAKKVNRKIADPSRKLFVWKEWVEFIQMRRIIVSRYHAPTQHQIRGFDHCHGDIFFELLQTENPEYLFDNEDSDMEEKMEARKKNKPKRNTKSRQRMKFMLEFFSKLGQLYPSKEETEFMRFKPSLTPMKSYLEEILAAHPEHDKVFPPNQANRAVKPFLDPSSLRASLRKLEIQLVTEEAPEATNIDFIPPYRDQIRLDYFCNEVLPKFVRLDTNISVGDWKAELLERQKREEEEKEREKADYHEGAKKHFDKKRALMKEKYGKEEPKEEETGVDMKKVTLLTSNYDVWVNFVHSKYISNDSFRKVSPGFPEIFSWLLDETALMVETDAMDIYRQLMVVENQFMYVFKPIKPKLDGLRYRNPKELLPNIKSASEYWRKFW